MNEVEINIPSDHVFERIVRDSAGTVARYLGLSDDRTADLQLAVSEAVTNAIEHGNKGNKDIKVGVHFVLQDDKLAVKVTDQGNGMPSLGEPVLPNIDDKLEEDVPRGLGIYLIQMLVDDIQTRSSDQGTEFTMIFNVNRKEEQPEPSLS